MRYWIAKITYKTTWRIWRFIFQFFLHWEAKYEDDRVLQLKEGNKPILLAVNHVNWADPFIAGVAVPNVFPIRYLTKAKLFRVPFVGQIIWLYGSIKMKRGIGLEKTLDPALQILENNGTVGIFPEGKIRRAGRPRQARRGAGYLAKKTHPTIIPIFISNGFRISFKEVFLRKRNITLYVGTPFKVPETKLNESASEVSRFIMNKVNSLRIYGK